MAEPQITEIATCFAAKLPTEGVSDQQATQAWRHALRYARETGAIERLTEIVEKAAPADPTVLEHCATLRR